ncbi:MAG: hypothetical protein ACUVWN_04585 [bacterium]
MARRGNGRELAGSGIGRAWNWLGVETARRGKEKDQDNEEDVITQAIL